MEETCTKEELFFFSILINTRNVNLIQEHKIVKDLMNDFLSRYVSTKAKCNVYHAK